jgi:hypothetical protein
MAAVPDVTVKVATPGHYEAKRVVVRFKVSEQREPYVFEQDTDGEPPILVVWGDGFAAVETSDGTRYAWPHTSILEIESSPA